ncbi:MAG: hypothetical protein ACMUHX_07910 [bacterium]
MNIYLSHQKGTGLFIFKAFILFLLFLFVFLSQPAKAQWFQPVPPIGFQTPLPFFQSTWFPIYPFFTPLSNPTGLTGGGPRPVLSPTAPLLGLPGLPAPTASIAGVTTIFVPLSATTGIKIIIKPPDLDTIKLEDLVAPYTVYIYPEGYEPPIAAAAGIFSTVFGRFLPFLPIF